MTKQERQAVAHSKKKSHEEIRASQLERRVRVNEYLTELAERHGVRDRRTGRPEASEKAGGS